VVLQPTRDQTLELWCLIKIQNILQWEATFPSTARRPWRLCQSKDPPNQFLDSGFGGAHRGRMCVCAFIEVTVCTCL
jgi:hypothetical protein